MISSELIRQLELDAASHPRQQAHISAASGLVIAGDWFYIVADDENHLAALRRSEANSGALRMLCLVEGELPVDPAARKRQKRDLEALFHLPGDGKRTPMLIAWGSGSRPQRDFAYAVELGAQGNLAGSVRTIALASLHGAMRSHVEELNIEAGFVQGDGLWLFSRANAGAPVNGCFRIDLAQAMDFLLGGEGSGVVPELDFSPLDMGRIGGVPLGITDATPLAEGGWLFSAVAENASNAYDDGQCEGTVLGVCDPDGKVAWMDRLEGGFKAEGIALDERGVLWLTTDADDPGVPSQLRCLDWPPAELRPETDQPGSSSENVSVSSSKAKYSA